MKNLVKRFVENKSGATAIEYGLIAAGIAVAIILRREYSRYRSLGPVGKNFRKTSHMRN